MTCAKFTDDWADDQIAQLGQVALAVLAVLYDATVGASHE